MALFPVNYSEMMISLAAACVPDLFRLHLFVFGHTHINMYFSFNKLIYNAVDAKLISSHVFINRKINNTGLWLGVLLLGKPFIIS